MEILESLWTLVLAAAVSLFAFLPKARAFIVTIKDLSTFFLGDNGLEPDEELLWPKKLRARFTDEAWEMEEIIKLRNTYFKDYLKKDTLTDDTIYWDVFKKNKHAFSIVSEHQEAFGYWGLIPVSRQSFFEFLSGNISHSEMISKRSISWREADPHDLYLYYIGAVTIPTNSPEKHKGGLPLRAAKVELDNIHVLYKISTFSKISGIVVYPSTQQGAFAIKKHFIRGGFKRTGIYVDDTGLTEIAHLEEENTHEFINFLYREYVVPHRSKNNMSFTKKLARLLNSKLVGVSFHHRVPERRLRDTAKLIRQLQQNKIVES